MQNKDIEIFLEIVNSRNITKAAEHLYLSQSVISTRLKKFEDELGYELFERGKGQREITLTSQGKELVPLAIRWRELYDEAERIKKKSQSMLRLAAPESVYYDFLEPHVVSFLAANPNARLTVKIVDSAEIYDLMESNLIDYGFASYESARSNIVHTHLYDQDFAIATASKFENINGAISPEILNPEKEIQLSGGNFSSVTVWREKWFSQKGSSRIEINSPRMMVELLKDEGTWALLPRTAAENMRELYGMRIYELSDKPEARKIYLLQHTNTALLTEAAKAFGEQLKDPFDVESLYTIKG